MQVIKTNNIWRDALRARKERTPVLADTTVCMHVECTLYICTACMNACMYLCIRQVLDRDGLGAAQKNITKARGESQGSGAMLSWVARTIKGERYAREGPSEDGGDIGKKRLIGNRGELHESSLVNQPSSIHPACQIMLIHPRLSCMLQSQRQGCVRGLTSRSNRESHDSPKSS